MIRSQAWTGREPGPPRIPGVACWRDRLGLGFRVGPWWCRFTWCRWGWTFYVFRRRIAWSPIDYSKVIDA